MLTALVIMIGLPLVCFALYKMRAAISAGYTDQEREDMKYW